MAFQFAAIIAFAIVGVGLGALLVGVSKLVAPHFPEADKSAIYECGEKPIGRAWFNFNPRFYLVALVFVIFEVDIALTFPVAVVYKKWVGRGASSGSIAFFELLLFTLILAAGLIWVWVNGDLRWMKELGERNPGKQGSAAEAPKSHAA
jgi:NADH-quinone oxidoreductase subunit A